MTNGEETLPFVLSGPALARDTLAGWQHWCRTRDSFAPAPVMDRATFRLLNRRKKMLHNLRRTATHANLPLLDTPMSLVVEKLLTGRIETNALKMKPTTRAGVMGSGGGYQGKTECVCEIAAAFQERWLALHDHLNPDAHPGSRDLHVPVAYAQTPVTAKPKSTCKAILDFFGAPIGRRTDLPDLNRQVAASLREHGNRVLILDDITRLRLHRADDQDTLA